MKTAELERFLTDSRALPGEKADAGLPRAMKNSAADRAFAAPEPLDAKRLNAKVGELLSRLADRIDEELPRVLKLATRAWDQVDSLTILDRRLGFELKAIGRTAHAMASEDDPVRRASGAAAALTLDAAAGLVEIFERRLAMLVRLRLRSQDAALIDDRGRPFLDAAHPCCE